MLQCFIVLVIVIIIGLRFLIVLLGFMFIRFCFTLFVI